MLPENTAFYPQMADLKEIFDRFYLGFVLCLLCIIGFFDWITGWELHFFIFYLLPIGIVAWRGSRLLCMLVVSLSILTWGTLDIFSGHVYSAQYIFIWNASVRLATFLIFALFLSKIKSAIQSREDSFNFIIHDLRAPFATISSGLSNLEDLTPLDQTQKETVFICRGATESGLILVNSILDLVRLENRKMKKEITSIDINKILESSLHTVSIFAKNRQVLLEKQIGPSSGSFFTDGQILERILVNLLMNAVKASKHGGRVSVFAKREGRSMLFHVVDEGRGIPSGSRVFTKFGQFHERGRGVAAGSGLGLAFCKLAVERLGGRINIRSQENVGTEVEFMLPSLEHLS